MVLIGELLADLIELSEKAGELARLIRKEDDLFKLLIEEKDEKSKNRRFLLDFKTLADVLIQQTIKYHLTKKVIFCLMSSSLKSGNFDTFQLINFILKYPKIDTIKGEENNQFRNRQGVTVEIELNDNPADLEKLLSQVLDEHPNSVKLLTDVIYKDSSIASKAKISELGNCDGQLFKVDLEDEDIGIWIDPIGNYPFFKPIKLIKFFFL